MKLKKRLLFVTIALAMVLFVACQENETTSQPAATEVTATDSGNNSEVEEEIAEIDWPTKPVQVIVPMGAGGDTDFNARTYGKYIKEYLGQDIAVVNITGNGGAVGSLEAKNAAQDGYTAMFYHTSLNINEATGMSDYGPEAFEMSRVAGRSGGEAVVVRADAPFETLTELLEYSAANPQTVKIAANTGATSHWASVVLNVEHDAKLNIVNTSSSAERVANLLGGHVDVIINPIGTVKDYVESGDFKYLAVTTSERLPHVPDVPTAKEQGVNLAYDLTYYVMFPKGTPEEIVEKFGKAIEEVSELPEYAEDIKTAYDQTPYVLDREASIEYVNEENEAMMKYEEFFR